MPWSASRIEKLRKRMMGNTIRRGAKMPESAKRAISTSLRKNKYRCGVPHPEPERQQVSRSVQRAHAEGRHAISAGKRDRDIAIVAARESGLTYAQCGAPFGLNEYAARKAVVRFKERESRCIVTSP